MQVSIKRPDTLEVTLTLSPSEASALLTLLTGGYDWLTLDHNWNPLVMILAPFVERAVIGQCLGGPYPFGTIEQRDPLSQPSESRRDDHLPSGNNERSEFS